MATNEGVINRSGTTERYIADTDLQNILHRWLTVDICAGILFLYTYFITARSSYASAVLRIVILYVCPSVCPSVTRVLCDETKEHTTEILIPQERVVGDVPFYLKFAPTNLCWCKITRVIILSCGIKISAVCSFVSSKSTRVTDGQTDRITIPRPR